MAFSVFAALYDRSVRETDYKPECSPGSVTTRNSVVALRCAVATCVTRVTADPNHAQFQGKNPAHLIRQIGDLMFTNARLLEDLVGKWEAWRELLFKNGAQS